VTKNKVSDVVMFYQYIAVMLQTGLRAKTLVHFAD